jgi:DNA-binding LacI/PurR family transcriptional regulator
LVPRKKNPPKKTPRMRDVAAAAGVSLSTVSLVINGKPGVNPERRERVLKTIKELGYVTEGHPTGQAENKVLGILMESFSEASRSDGFYARIVSGIEDTAFELGYHVLLHVYRPDVDPIHSIQELMGRNVDGLIIANDGDVTPEVIQKIADAGRPLVLVENRQPGPIQSVTGDNITAGRIMTEYLIELGHRRRTPNCPDRTRLGPGSIPAAAAGLGKSAQGLCPDAAAAGPAGTAHGGLRGQ